MRVIAGLYRGRIISTVNDRSVRPATDRVRQTIFDLLVTRMTLDGATVLDLFAGSGSLGIEALSRGARHATFVEDSTRIARSIHQNLLVLGCAPQSEVIEMDASQYIRSAAGSFDLIFADPPYAYDRTRELPGEILKGGFLKPRGFLVIEHTKDIAFADTALCKTGPVKRFGTTMVTFFEGISA